MQAKGDQALPTNGMPQASEIKHNFACLDCPKLAAVSCLLQHSYCRATNIIVSTSLNILPWEVEAISLHHTSIYMECFVVSFRFTIAICEVCNLSQMNAYFSDLAFS